MPKEIDKIISDLSLSEESSRASTKELREVFEHMLENKPIAQMDEGFKIKLRRSIVEKAKAMQRLKQKRGGCRKISLTINNLSYAAIGAAVVLLVLSVGIYGFKPVDEGSRSLIGGVTVITAEDRAFGDLKALSYDISQEGTAGRGGGGLATVTGSTETAGVLGAKIGALPEIIQYRFIYQGRDFNIESDKMNVYKRLKGSELSERLVGSLGNAGMGVIQLDNLEEKRVESISLGENKEYGYLVYVNLKEGLVTVNENWEKWQAPDNCEGGICQPYTPLSREQIPVDETLIRIAGDFLQKLGVDLSSYAEPIVEQETHMVQPLAGEDFYVPEIINVKYPLIVQNNEVYEDFGALSGVMVSVNIRRMKASSIWDLAVQKYQSSSYEVETDVSRLIELAAKGGHFRYDYPEAGKVVEVVLGEPKVGLMRYWKYAENQNEELLVPALIFPVAEAPEGEYFYQQNVVIPLVKEILDNYLEDNK